MSGKRTRRRAPQSYRKKEQLYRKPEINDHRTLFSPEAQGSDPDNAGDTENTGANGADGDSTASAVGTGNSSLSDFQLTPEAKADRFLTLWNKRVRPFRKYPGFRRLVDGLSVEEVFFQVKVWYKHQVNTQGWSEEKYEFVLDKIFSAGAMLSRASFVKYAFLYDHGRQRSSTRSSGTTSSIYDHEEKQAKISEVLSAWDALDALDDDDDSDW